MGTLASAKERVDGPPPEALLQSKAEAEKSFYEEKAADDKRIAELKAADDKRLQDDKSADDKRYQDDRAAADARHADQRAAEDKRYQDDKAAADARYADQQAEAQRAQDQRAADDRRAQDQQSYNTPPPSYNDPTSPGYNEPQRTYESDLFQVAKYGATLEPHLPHPEMPGASGFDIHARSQLFPREEAVARNASSGYPIPPYHEERPIIGYSTSMATDDLSRAHQSQYMPAGPWGTHSDTFSTYNTPEAAKAALSLSYLPEYTSNVGLRPGTYVEASRPDSDAVRQFNYKGVACYDEPKKLG